MADDCAIGRKNNQSNFSSKLKNKNQQANDPNVVLQIVFHDTAGAKSVLASLTVSFFKPPHSYWFPPSKSCVGDQIDWVYASKLGGGSQLILHSMEKTRSGNGEYILWNKRRWQWISWKLRGPRSLCASELGGGKQSMSRGKWGESRGEEEWELGGGQCSGGRHTSTARMEVQGRIWSLHHQHFVASRSNSVIISNISLINSISRKPVISSIKVTKSLTN